MSPTAKHPQLDTMTNSDTGRTTQEQAITFATTWLANAADDRQTALSQWQTQGLTPLACGRVFSAVRIPAHLVWAAVGTQNLKDADTHISWWFYTCAVFMGLHRLHYYALVGPTVPWRWSNQELPGVEYLGRGNYLSVPAPWLTEPKGRAYWCRLESPGELCYTDEVVDLIRNGLAARSEAETR